MFAALRKGPAPRYHCDRFDAVLTCGLPVEIEYEYSAADDAVNWPERALVTDVVVYQTDGVYSIYTSLSQTELAHLRALALEEAREILS